MARTIRSLSFVLFMLLMIVPVGSVHAQTPQQTLTQYLSDLQKNLNDYALREKIIKHVQTMRPKPAVPEEARRYFVEGNALLKAAKEQKGYGLAIDSYRQCLLIAPWWAEAYNNYAVALELAGQFDESVNALKLYIATNPGEAESRKVQDKIYEIGAKKKIAAKEKEESSQKAVSAPKQSTFEDLLKKIDGRRYASPLDKGYTLVIDVRGKVFVLGTIGPDGSYHEQRRQEIRGREFTSNPPRTDPPDVPYIAECTFIISQDGDSVTYRWTMSWHITYEKILLWQR